MDARDERLQRHIPVTPTRDWQFAQASTEHEWNMYETLTDPMQMMNGPALSLVEQWTDVNLYNDDATTNVDEILEFKERHNKIGSATRPLD